MRRARWRGIGVPAAPAPAAPNADEKPTAPDAVASPPPSARPHRSVPTPVLMGEIEADLGANLRPERPTPKRILQRDDAPIDETTQLAPSGAGSAAYETDGSTPPIAPPRSAVVGRSIFTS